MGIAGHGSGNLNDVRGYPLADTASRRDADGKVMPEYVLNDCHLWWPDHYGELGYVSTATASPGLMTVTFAAYNAVSAVATALAAVSIPRINLPYRSYPVVALQPGVGGWAAMGRIPNNLTGVNTWRFDDYAAGLLLPRLAQAYPAYPVPTVGKLNTLPVLTDSVRFLGGSNLTVTEGYRYIDGMLRRCIVFSLDPDQLPELYELFAGPCGVRPENGNCRKQGIRKINNVVPDAAGLIYLEIDDANGVISGLIDNPDGLPAEPAGVRLTTPIDFADICAPVPSPAPIQPDACDNISSSSVPAVIPLSSSSIPAVQFLSSSSSATAAAVVYNFGAGEEDEVADFSLFESRSVHKGEWDLDTAAGEVETLLRYDGGLLTAWREHYEASDETARTILNNKYDAKMEAVGNFVEIEMDWKLIIAELNQIGDPTLNDTRVVVLALQNRRFGGIAQEKSLSLRISYDKNLNVNLGVYSSNGGVVSLEKDIGTWRRPQQDVLNDSAKFRIEYVNGAVWNWEVEFTSDADWQQSSSSFLSSSTTASQLVVTDNGTTGALTTPVMRFCGLRLTMDGGVGSGTVSPVDFLLRRFLIRSNKLDNTACNVSNFDGENDTITYAVRYDPAAGWSNDFGTGRAMTLMSQPASTGDTNRQAFNIISATKELRYQQYLEAPITDYYRYRVLDCETSVADSYLFSCAVQVVSGNPKIGLMLGYQGDARDNFWFVALDVAARTMIYGQHHLPHAVDEDVAISLSSVGVPISSNFSLEWHRLIVRVTSGFQVSVWVDPIDRVMCSSSSYPGGCATKTIPVGDPNILITKADDWDGNEFDSSKLEDGAPGVFCYGGGAARIAEFTVSPQGQDIVVPSKATWLTR